jgi:hypothetical protein
MIREKLMDSNPYFPPFAVRWQPPYSNVPKYHPCMVYKEAEMLRDWFRSLDLAAEIVRYEMTEREVDYG